MQRRREAFYCIGHKTPAFETAAPTHATSVFGRRLAAVVLGIVPLALSSLIHTAAATTTGANWIVRGAI